MGVTETPSGGIDVGSCLQLWIELQNAVCALIDSSTGDPSSEFAQVQYHSFFNDLADLKFP